MTSSTRCQGKEQMTFERHAFVIGGPDVVEFVSAEASIAGKTVRALRTRPKP